MRFPARCRHLLCLFLISPAAHADVSYNRVDLVCSPKEHVALVRFARSWNDDPVVYPRLPSAVDHGLSASDGSDRTDCTLPDGTTIRVRGGEDQAFGYGQGGADPPAFFSLWVNQRRVASGEEWRAGYQRAIDDLPVLAGVVIEPQRLTRCSIAEGKAPVCTRQPLDLAAVPVDRVEYDGRVSKPVVGSYSAIAKGDANQRFCRAWLDQHAPRLDAVWQGGAVLGEADGVGPFEDVDGIEGHARSGVVDLRSGTSRRLMVWEEENHYFDGTVMVLAPVDMTPKRIAAAYPFESIESWPGRASPAGVTLISGGQKQLYPGVSPRYIHLALQRIDGQLHVLAWPTNHQVRPTAALVRPLADGGFFTVCAFNRVEPHF